MFGWLKKQMGQVQDARAEVAGEAAMDALRMKTGLDAAIGGLSAAAAKDPFVVGVVGTHAAILTKVITAGKCPQAVTEDAMIQALVLAFGSQAVDRTKAIGLLFEFKNHPDFRQGSQVATLVLAAKYGRKDLQFDPLVVSARQSVRDMPAAFRNVLGDTEDEQVAAQLSQDLLVKPLLNKYGHEMLEFVGA